MDIPRWLEELKSKYQCSIAHIFVLHGNTKDLWFAKEKVIQFNNLLDTFLNFRNFVARYDLAGGWSFPNEECQQIATHFINPSTPGIGYRPSPSPSVGSPSVGSPSVGSPSVESFASSIGSSNSFDDYKDPSEAFMLIKKMLKNSDENRSCAIVIDHAESLLSSDGWGRPNIDLLVTYLRKWAVDPEIVDAGNILVIVCKDDFGALHPALKDPEAKIESIYLPYPDREYRLDYVNAYIDANEAISIAKNGTRESIASNTAGLSLEMIEDCLLRCVADQSGDILGYVKERKDEIISTTYKDVIEIMEPRFGFESIGGLSIIKKYVLNNVIEPLRNNDIRRCPMGILMTGPPGTGKSIMAEAIAKHSDVVFVTLRFSKIFSKWVGDSERNLDKVLLAIKSMAPAIVFIDEIDQSGHRRGGAGEGDSGVSSRVFQRLLEFMSDTGNRGKVVFLAATNRPDLLDPAMKRSGRFDKKIPFLAPDKVMRGQIVKAIMKKNDMSISKNFKVPAEFLNVTEGWVGSDIEALVLMAYEIAMDNKKSHIDKDSLMEAARVTRPSVSAQQIHEMTVLALEECNDLRLIPKDFEHMI